MDLDDEIDDDAKRIWDKWYSTLSSLNEVTITRCLALGFATPYFWTDSMCVLRYIQNTKCSFKIFVANRLEVIHEATDTDR